MDPLVRWQNFYVIVGSSAAALSGVQFVVVALIASLRVRTTAESIGAFGTPTLVQFGGALLVSAIMCAPWPSLIPMSVAVAICGLGGVGYGAIVILRARRQTTYKPVWDDWLYYTILPCSLYIVLALAPLFLHAATQLAMFAIGGAVLGLLLNGIRNAWDSVTHLVVRGSADGAREGE